MSEVAGAADRAEPAPGPVVTRSRRLGTHAPALLAVAAACLVLTAAVYVLALGTDDLLRFDRDLRFPQIVGDWKLRDDASYRFSRASEIVFLASGAMLLLGTLALGGIRRAGVVAAVVAAGSVAAWTLAAALGATDPVGGEALRSSQGAFPSGHAAIAMSLGLGLVVALPPRARAAGGALAVAFASTVAVGVIALGWHYPSDVIGAFLVSTAAAAAVLAVAPRIGRGAAPPARSRVALTALVTGATALAAVMGAVALNRLPDETAGAFADAHPRFIGFCVITVLLTTTAAATVAHLLGNAHPHGS